MYSPLLISYHDQRESNKRNIFICKRGSKYLLYTYFQIVRGSCRYAKDELLSRFFQVCQKTLKYINSVISFYCLFARVCFYKPLYILHSYCLIDAFKSIFFKHQFLLWSFISFKKKLWIQSFLSLVFLSKLKTFPVLGMT